jgi:flavodoxin
MAKVAMAVFLCIALLTSLLVYSLLIFSSPFKPASFTQPGRPVTIPMKTTETNSRNTFRTLFLYHTELVYNQKSTPYVIIVRILTNTETRRRTMKYAVIYDSIHGNTEKIAEAIAKGLGKEGVILKTGEVKLSDLKSIDLLVIGSPTYGGRPTPDMLAFLREIHQDSLKGVNVAAFDTRIPANWVKIFGFAAGKIEKTLKKLGGTPVVKREGFFVTGTKGPLAEGELKRAEEFAKSITTVMTSYKKVKKAR